MAHTHSLLLLLVGVAVSSLGHTRTSPAEMVAQSGHVQGDATLGREPQPSLDMKTNHTQTSPDHRLNRVKPSPNLTTNHTQQTSTDHRMSHTRSNPILRPPLPLIPPSTQEDGSIELSKDAFRSRTSSQPRRRDTSSSGDPGPHPQGSDGDGGNVDNVLAALVGYSRDPELWRFVHSVVDELDYSRRARSKVPIRSRLPALHLSPSRGRRWRAAPVDQNKSPKNWMNESQSIKISSGDDGGGGNVEDIGEGMTSSAPPQLLPPPTHLISEDHFDLLERTQQPGHHYNTSSDTRTLAHQDNNTITVDPSTRPPHFIFHKVYVEANYNGRGRQPYRRPVLAVMAVSNDRTSAIATTKDKDSDIAASMDIITYHLATDSTKELPDKSEMLSVTQKNISELSDEDIESVEQIKMENTPDDIPEFWKKMQRRNHNKNRFAYKARKLYSFKNQIKFLQRWEQKLWRRSQRRSP
ncbi:uncharacterized protein LOC121876720 [Homarus americanus]|uniref:uncharacterized protein LOC121876720 n=1 Tax=Homarus americanus TaxID=6706 RepID=UPI001C464168|nr:uncharacterized protein LOC121876720 [Homarus americanus]XP_042238012.1 uncharacterized protein LOC121876720 [Homarus americanus]XP_042238013.1 uncharacterized protein LOC121876720 [Homarus americanus]